MTFDKFGHFLNQKTEENFLVDTWQDNKKTLLQSTVATALIIFTMGIVDCFRPDMSTSLLGLFLIARLLVLIIAGATIVNAYKRDNVHSTHSFIFALKLSLFLLLGLVVYYFPSDPTTPLNFVGVFVLNHIMLPVRGKQTVLPSIILAIIYMASFIVHDTEATSYLSALIVSIAPMTVLASAFINRGLSLQMRRSYLQHTKLKEIHDNQTRFISILGHDLKNSMMIINLQSEVLTSRFEKLESSDVLLRLTKLKQQALNTTSLLERLLNWSKDIQHHTLTIIPTSVIQVVMNCFDFLGPIALDKNIQLITGDFPPLVQSDPYALESVLRNLVQNSIKYSPKDSIVEIRGEIQGQTLILEVIDQGMGMDPEILESINNGDFVKSAIGTDGEEGHGVGLSFCLGLLNKLQHPYEVISVKGQGTRTKILIPIS